MWGYGMKLDVFFNEVRPMFGVLTADQVRGIEGIINAFNEVGDGDKDTLAYALATAFHETGKRMVPVREGFCDTDAEARSAVERLALKRGQNSSVAKYAKPTGPYGHVYYGRGHVQQTWLDNYKKSSADAGVDLVKNPDAMLDPKISARVLIKGLIDGRWNGRGYGLPYYKGKDNILSDDEAIEARQTVNGSDKAKLIAGYHRNFYNALTKAGFSAIQRNEVNGILGWVLKLIFGGK